MIIDPEYSDDILDSQQISIEDELIEKLDELEVEIELVYEGNLTDVINLKEGK